MLIFQVANSMLIVPYLIYFSISKWTYPMKDYIGESGCFFLTFSRGMYQYEVQLSSFFMVFFRYICLFHGNYLQRIKLTPNVSFITYSTWFLKSSGILTFFFWLWLEPQRPIHLHLIFEISSSKNLVRRTGFFVYFKLDFCRLHRQ